MNDATLEIVLSAAEVAVLVVALVVALLLIARELTAIREAFDQTSATVGELERELGETFPGVTELNYALERIAEDLPGIAEKAEELAARR